MESNIDFAVFRDNLKILIESSHLMYKDVARGIGVSPVTLARYMNGERTPDLEYVARLSTYFGVTMEWLTGMDGAATKTLTDDQQRLVDLFGISSREDKDVIMMILNKYTDGPNRE